MPGEAFIIAAKRTPIGRRGGGLAAVPIEDLLAPLILALVAETGIDPDEIDDVIVGNAAGPGGNPARLAALQAGLPVDVPGVSVDRQCGSGLEAVNLAAARIRAGDGDVYLAGGAESPSTAPLRARRDKDGDLTFYPRARFAPDAIGDPDMGVAAENVARQCGISRERQDAFALASHQKACAAMADARLAAEIVPLDTPGGRVSVDACPRPDTSLDALAALPPVFVKDGTVTAGNACPVNDGAALVCVVSARMAERLAPSVALSFIGGAARGVDPNVLGLGPVASTRTLLERNPGLSLDGIEHIEFNEAFAAQVLGSLDALAIDAARVNSDGGALAFGHPWGASGAFLVVRLFSQMVRRTDRRTRRGLAMIGIGGGLGISSLFETA
ncbi:MAG: thiolase family protein [Pseudomonadota bacterium]